MENRIKMTMEKKKPEKLSSYEVLQRSLEVVNIQIDTCRDAQRNDPMSLDTVRLVTDMARSVPLICSELRKTAAAAQKAVDNMTPELQTELIMALVADMSPEHREALGLYIKDLGSKLIR